jgi:hypothetical protein
VSKFQKTAIEYLKQYKDFHRGLIGPLEFWYQNFDITHGKEVDITSRRSWIKTTLPAQPESITFGNIFSESHVGYFIQIISYTHQFILEGPNDTFWYGTGFINEVQPGPVYQTKLNFTGIEPIGSMELTFANQPSLFPSIIPTLRTHSGPQCQLLVGSYEGNPLACNCSGASKCKLTESARKRLYNTPEVVKMRKKNLDHFIKKVKESKGIQP